MKFEESKVVGTRSTCLLEGVAGDVACVVNASLVGCSDVKDVVLLSPVVDSWVVVNGLEVVASRVVWSLKFDISKVVGTKSTGLLEDVAASVACVVSASLSAVVDCVVNDVVLKSPVVDSWAVVNGLEVVVSSVVAS